MNRAEIIQQALNLRDRLKGYGEIRQAGKTLGYPEEAAKAQVCEFLRNYAGANSAFLKQAEAATGHTAFMLTTLTALINSFVQYLQAGLATGLSPERQAQIDVVSDILGQAQIILESEAYHPAAAAILVGASLEEFLRNWVDEAELDIGSTKASIDAYAKILRGAELVSKQDIKDITAWAGIRNHAAHGEWEQVADRNRVRIMLESVNLFIRQKTSSM